MIKFAPILFLTTTCNFKPNTLALRVKFIFIAALIKSYLANPWQVIFAYDTFMMVLLLFLFGSQWLTVEGLFYQSFPSSYAESTYSGTSQCSLCFTPTLPKPRVFLSPGNFVNHSSAFGLSAPRASVIMNI